MRPQRLDAQTGAWRPVIAAASLFGKNEIRVDCRDTGDMGWPRCVRQSSLLGLSLSPASSHSSHKAGDVRLHGIRADPVGIYGEQLERGKETFGGSRRNVPCCQCPVKGLEV